MQTEYPTATVLLLNPTAGETGGCFYREAATGMRLQNMSVTFSNLKAADH